MRSVDRERRACRSGFSPTPLRMSFQPTYARALTHRAMYCHPRESGDRYQPSAKPNKAPACAGVTSYNRGSRPTPMVPPSIRHRLSSIPRRVRIHCAPSESADPRGGIGTLSVGHFIPQPRRTVDPAAPSQKRRPIGAGRRSRASLRLLFARFLTLKWSSALLRFSPKIFSIQHP